MTAIEVHFLTGRFVATAHHDRGEHEWPPHGSRLFSAMVAAWADSEDPDGSERTALEWLEMQPPPRITAPQAVPRRTVRHFVPVNDTRVISPSSYDRRAVDIEELLEQFEGEVEAAGGELTKKAERLRNKLDKKADVDSLVGSAGNTNVVSALALLPDERGKKERSFPSVTLVAPESVVSTGEQQSRAAVRPRHNVVTYVWDGSPPELTAEALDGLLGRVTRLGHSSTLVSCRLTDAAPPATHVPGEGTSMLRWVRRGQLAALEREHARHQGVSPRSLPFHAVRYREYGPEEVVSSEVMRPTTAGDWIVFEIVARDRRLPLTRTVELSKVLRDAMMSRVPDPLPEGVSGHRIDGGPSSSPHISFLALPNVGHEHADGRIMGLAISLPDGLDEVARTATLVGIRAWEAQLGGRPLQLQMGSRGDVEMRRKQPPFTLRSLNPAVWSSPSQRWASATPVALPAHPGSLGSGSAAARAKAWTRALESVAKSCEHVGLPRPVDVTASLVPDLIGTRPARAFPVFRQGRGGVTRRLVHVAVEFSEPIRGPLVLGSGRFLGLGLMRPMDGPVTNELSGKGRNSDG